MQKPPQERATPYDFEYWHPHVRATADDNGITFESRGEYESRYSSAMWTDEIEAVRELRDYLDAYLEHHDATRDD